MLEFDPIDLNKQQGRATFTLTSDILNLKFTKDGIYIND